MFGIDAPEAAKALVDEAAIKLDPLLEKAIESLVTKLRALLVGRTITITIT